MKTFEDICRMTQTEVKEYMFHYLSENGYDNIDANDGYLYAKGTEPVLLVAHMDTVHQHQCIIINNVKGKLSSPQGIGGDDRCGIFIIMNIVKELKCSVLLCEDEEKGCIGANKFVKTEHIKNLGVNYMIEFDRKGNSDAVFYSCDNKEFIDFVTDVSGFQFANGSVSDISALMPASKLSAVNLSSGYYNAHTVGEYVMYDEMMDTVEAAKVLIKEKVDKPFEYVRKVYTPSSFSSFNRSHSKDKVNVYFADNDFYSENFLDGLPYYNDEQLANMARNDTDLELEVTIYGMALSEEVLHAVGETKAECWMNMFLENPNLCFNDIVDYSWC